MAKPKINPAVPARVVIDRVSPEIDGGIYPVKRVTGESVEVRAHCFTDGHDQVLVFLLYKDAGMKTFDKVLMTPLGNDEYTASFTVEKQGTYFYTVQASLDGYGRWRKDTRKKFDDGQDIRVDLMTGAEILERTSARLQGKKKTRLSEAAAALKAAEDVEDCVDIAEDEKIYQLCRDHPDPEKVLTYSKELPVYVDRSKAGFSTWYELFPRSWGEKPGEHGTFKSCERLLPEIFRMGFDVIYLPPIHPIGVTNRKGKNNSPKAGPDDVGSPWAIGAKEGGHKAVHPKLGTLKDFQRFVKKAKEYDIEIALDLAYQCSPDHPYVKEHPEWFKWRPDGTIQYAENPPKKYEDVLPIDFESEDWRNLWDELKSVVEYWIEQGVRIFRVDNPHTKPFVFWDWLIAEIKAQYPDVLFLAEAFTRPKVMARLAKGGFTQSYTYFTWRNTKDELTQYMKELTRTELADVFRPNFWPNTPDILPEHLQYGGRAAFMTRYALAATLSSNIGIYGPVFDLCENEPMPGKEENNNNEKYQIRDWDWDREGNLKDFIALINRIRKENPALQSTKNIRFTNIENEQILTFYKTSADMTNIILVIVNLDPYHVQSGWVAVPLKEIGMPEGQVFLAHDLISGDRYFWQKEFNYVELNPRQCPVHIIKIRQHIRREQDFDYFM